MNMQTLQTLDYDEIKARLREYVQSGLGKKLVDDLRPAADPRAVAQMLRETAETRAILDIAGQLPLHGLADLTEDLERAARGAVLEPAALTALADLLRGCRGMKLFMARFREAAPQVSAYAGAITVMEDLEERIERCIENNRVSSAASPRLARIRAQIDVLKGRIKEKMHSFLTAARFHDCLQEQIVSLRDGRYCLAVKSSQRHRIDGTVLGSSGSGQTVFVEPSPVRALTNELRVLEGEEEAEVYQVLVGLTGEVAARLPALRVNVETMAVYDFAQAKAKYGRAIGGIAAELLPTPQIIIQGGRHPLLGREAVPLDFTLGGDCRTLLITGPNTGGKTVVLKTVGLFALLTQSGLLVPAERAALGVFDRVLADIGDRQDIVQSLSTFSGHVRNLVAILAEARRGSLVLLDEIGTGTDPAEGAALAAAVLDDLHEAGALTVATTHYGELKRFADGRPGFRNARMEFDPETLRPLFRLTIGRAGRSNGLWIAERLGMARTTLEKARGFLGKDPEGKLGVGSQGVEETESSGGVGSAGVDEPWETSGGVRSRGVEEPEPEGDAGSLSRREEGGEQREEKRPYQVGDSVYVGNTGERGIICALADDRGEVTVLVREKRVKVNEKRIRLHLAKEELYPDHERYDLDIVLLSKDDRRLKKAMAKRHVAGKERILPE